MNTILTADNPPPFLRLPTARWLCRLRASKGYNSSVRILGGAWFLLLAFFAAGKVLSHAQTVSTTNFGPAGWPELLSAICLFLFYLALCSFVLLRPSPAARIHGLLPSLIAFAGTYLPWTIVLLAPDEASVGRSLVSAVLLLTGTALTVVVICHLGRSFSIIPQAHVLVRTGPYAVVRNPLYLAEEVALLGSLLQYFSPLTTTLFVVHGALQIRRIFYEENLLRQSFPDYDAYARATSRLIPHIW